MSSGNFGFVPKSEQATGAAVSDWVAPALEWYRFLPISQSCPEQLLPFTVRGPETFSIDRGR